MLQSIRTHPTLIVDRDTDGLTGPDSDHPQCTEHGHVHFFADDDTQRWRALKAFDFHIPSAPSQQLVARGGECGEVSHVAAGHEPDAGVAWQPEQFE